MRRLLLACVLPVTFIACGDRRVEPRPLNVTIEASRASAPTGAVVGFLVSAEGRRLTGITVDYGDGVVEQLTVHSSTTASAVFEHTYSATGSYRVRATVLDAIAGSKEASVEVRIE